jgi:hypothetical protein
MGSVDIDLEGLDTVCDNVFLEARKRIPTWTRKDTMENKCAGYPQITAAFEDLHNKLLTEYRFGNVAVFLDTLARTMEVMNPAIYEYYRSLMELFRTEIKNSCGQLSDLRLSSGESFGTFHVVGEGKPEMEVFREAIRKGCRQNVLLTEKYQAYL